jgi:hypothetical protein
MEVNFDQVELGVAVNLATLRHVLKRLSINGKRWWIASDPADAAMTRSITIGHGDPGCIDRLNTLYFTIPVLGSSVPGARTDNLVLLFDPSTSAAAEPGYYMEDGRVIQDSLEDFFCFFQPIIRALAARLQEESQSQKGER